jgi:ERCC4-type nuclease
MMMNDELTDFVEAHPNGWDHQEWLGLLKDIESQGGDISDPDAVGLQLEKERLALELSRKSVPGLGPKRIESVVGHFETLWGLRQASPEEIAEVPSIHKGLAAKVAEAVR